MGTKNGVNDGQRIDTTMDCLQQRAPQFCFNTDSHCSLRCSCLSCLDEDESLRNAVALCILWFLDPEKQTQQILITEKTHGVELVVEKRGGGATATGLFIPHKTKPRNLEMQRCANVS